jgi:UDP-N-acetylglucosamine--N-acetylmuramyl-(pentapeptide) pyrophosphoryl-undecaprenol N-acetylglucosamine transferase
VLKNLRDIVLIAIGIVQSISYFLIRRPDVVFCKGGYVCVPVGIAARIFKIPLIIHDSDTHPGLTNRFLSRWAQKIGTGMPPKYYNYPKQKMVYSGIPVQKAFMPASAKEQAGAKKALMLNPDSPVILITGGGTGAQELNQAATNAVESLLAKGWQLILVTGKGKSSAAKKMRDSLSERYKRQWIIQEFAEMLPLVKAADVVVSRAGATAMQEFANAKKAVVVVPSPYLTGGHQLKNAAMFEDTNAAIVLQEQQLQAEPGVLASTLESLVNDMQLRNKLATNLHKQFAKPHATEQIAALIANAANSKQ